jgi:hypothetical protein
MALTRLDRLKYPAWVLKLTNHELLQLAVVAHNERRWTVLRNEMERRHSLGIMTFDDWLASDARIYVPNEGNG